MKKFILPFLFLFLISISGMSQFATSKYGSARNEMTFAKQTFDPSTTTFKTSEGTLRLGATIGFLLSRLRQEGYDYSKDRAGFQFGGHAQYYFSQQLVFMTGLLFAFHGTNFDDDDNYGFKITSLLIPLMVGYYVIPQLMIMAGIQPGFILSFKDTDGDDLKDFYKGFDFGIKFGAMYNITEFLTAKLAYNIGVADYLENNENDPVTSRMLEISIVYWLWNNK